MKLLDRIDAIARENPDRVAYLHGNGDATLTYGQLADEIANPDAYRRRTLLLHASNTFDVPIQFLVAMANGLDVLMTHDSAAAAEVSALAERVQADEIFSKSPAVKWSTPCFREPLPVDASPPRAGGALLLATSGSTGIPKVVRRTAESIDAVSANMVEAIGFTSNDRVLAAVPLTHSYGVEHGLLAPLWAGATVVIADGLDLPSLEAAFSRGITIFPAVPSMIERLADVGHPVAGIESVRRIYSAGGPLPAGTRERFSQRYGRPVGQLFGATEVGTVLYRAEPGAEGNVGWPMRDVSVRVLSINDRSQPAAPGELGEVAIRSPSMFEGYVGGEPADLVDGHFLTGDLGRIKADGSLQLEGRSRLLIDTGGLKVNPLEVERVLEQHPAVASCVVVGVRQSETVSRLRAVIIPRGDAPSPDDIRAFARARLAPYKVPRAIEFRSELPRSPTGKVLRHIVEST